MDFYDLLFARKMSGGGGGGGGISPAVKTALLAAFSKVAWVDENGQDYYDTLASALYTPADLSSINAVYSGGSVTTATPLDDLKNDLVVTALWSDSSTSTVGSDYYTLSGTLDAGTSVVTVSYLGKTTTFNVTVAGGKSDMNGWTDGIKYTDITIVENEYVNKNDGSFPSYQGWDRTGYVPCNGAKSISLPALRGTGGQSLNDAFYTESKTFISAFSIEHSPKTVNVPNNAYYFVLSEAAEEIAYVLETGVVPNAE